MIRRSPEAPRSRLRSALPLLLPLSFLACGQGEAGCDQGSLSCGVQYEYPQSTLTQGIAPVDDSVRFRLTQAGLDFVQARLPDLIQGFGTAFQPDPQNPAFFRFQLTDAIELNDSPRIALGVDADGEWASPTVFWLRRAPLLEELHFELVEAPQQGIAAHIEDLVLGIDGRLYAAAGGGEAACNIIGTNSTVCPAEAEDCDGMGLLTSVSFDLLITPRIGSGAECDFPQLGECFLIDADVANVTLGNFDSSSLEITAATSCVVASPEPDCDGECSDTGTFDGQGDAECRLTCEASDFIADSAASLSGALEDTFEGILDGFVEDALGDALADIDGMPATAAARLDLETLLPFGASALDVGYDLSPGAEAFDINCAAGTDCAGARGMDIVMSTGVEAAPDEAPSEAVPPHDCVLPVDEAAFLALYGASEFTAPLDVALTGEQAGVPYHLGLSIARVGMNQALFAAYNTGVLCLDLDSEDVHALTSGAFPLSAGTLNTLTGGQLAALTPSSSPALVTLTPSSPPVARLGAGDETEGHLILEWKRVRVGFYVFLYERYARVFAVDVDLSLELTALYDDVGQILELSISSGPTLENYEQVYSELLPGVDYTELLEGLVGNVIDQMLGGQLSFEVDLGIGGLLSNATGVPLAVEVSGIETVGPSGTRERLNLYFTLKDGAVSPLVKAAIGDVVVHSRSDDVLRIAGAYRRIDDGLQVLARVDGGAWHGPFASADGFIDVQHPSLVFPGVHDVELRARRAGSHGAFTAVRTQVEVPSWQAPLRVTLERDGDRVAVFVRDGDGSERSFAFAWAKDGEWSDFEPLSSLPLAALDDVRTVSVKARDNEGRVSRPVSVDLETKAWR